METAKAMSLFTLIQQCPHPYLTLPRWRHGTPQAPHDLARHECIGIRQGDEAYGTWRLSLGKRMETVKVRGNLSTNL